jgi:hypothetical protein
VRALTVGQRVARVLLALLFLSALSTTLIPSGRALVRGALLLPPLLWPETAGVGVVGGEDVRHVAFAIPSANGIVSLDVYTPSGAPPPIPGARGAMLFIPGVGDNRTIPQLVNLATSLARTGEVVMLMTTPTLIRYDLDPADRDAVVQAFERLAHWPGVGANRVGIVGFSGGGPLACLAAADPRIRDRVAFITMFGSYFDVRDYLRDIGRRAIIENGVLVPWHVSTVPLEVLANVLAPTLPVPDGQRLEAGFAFNDPNPLAASDVTLLSPAGQAAYHLLVGDQPERVDSNIAMLQPGAGNLLTQLSPSSLVSQIHAPIYLLHDRNDTSIPYTEASDFAAALTRLRHPHDFLIFDIFDHTQVQSGLGPGKIVGDGILLVRILVDMLSIGS